MKPLRGRRIAWISMVLGLLVLAAGAWIFKERALELWWIRRLDSPDLKEKARAFEKLGELRSLRAVPNLIQVLKESKDVGDQMWQTALLRAFFNIGPQAVAEAFKEIDHESGPIPRWYFFVLDKNSMSVIIQCLKNPDPRVRFRALQWIDRQAIFREELVFPFRSVPPELSTALDDPSEEVRSLAATMILLRYPDHLAARRGVREALKSPRLEIRRMAVQSMASRFSPHGKLALPELLQCLKDPDEGIRVSATRHLGFKRCEEAFPGMLVLLRGESAECQSEALAGLSRLADSLVEELPFGEALPALKKMLESGDEDSIRKILGILGKLGRRARPVEQEVLGLFKFKGDIRAEAALTLCRMGACSREAVEALVQEVGNVTSLSYEEEGIFDLIRLDPRDLVEIEAVPRLLSVLDVHAGELLKRSNAPLLLGAFLPIYAEAAVARGPKAEEVQARLIRLLGSPGEDREVRANAAAALGRWRPGAVKALPALIGALGSSRVGDKVRRAAAWALGELGAASAAALPALETAAAARGEDWKEAAAALWIIDPRRLPEALRHFNLALQEKADLHQIDSDLFEKVAVLGAHAAGAVPGLIQTLKEWPGYLRGAMDYSLSRIGKPAVPALIELLRSENVIWRAHAAEALGLIGPAAEQAAPALRAALSDGDEEVRREAEKALKRVTALVNRLHPPEPLPADRPRLAPLLVDGGGAPISSREAWEKRRGEIRARWLAFLGEFPRDRVPLEPEVLAEEERPLFTRKRLRYRIEEGVLADGYLLLPKLPLLEPGRKRPGAVVFHQTVETHAMQPAGVDPSNRALMIGVHLAERGAVAWCPRCYIFAPGAGYAEAVREMQARHPAWKGMARMLFDAVRAVDFLESLPEVDRSRLGCIGHSLGAKEALYAAAFDERLQAAVFSEGGIGLTFSNWDAIWYLGSGIREPGFPLEHHQLIALIAPRAFLLLAGAGRSEGADGLSSWSFIEAALPVYRLLGAEEKLGWVHHGQGHAYPRLARAAAEEFLERQLGR